MQREHRVHVRAPADVVWEVWSDVAAWPDFIGPVHDLVARPPRLVPGARVRIVRPGIPTDEWTVVDVDPGRGWTWEARGPGVVSVGTHLVQAGPDETSEAVARVVQRGPVGTTIGWMFGPLVARHLRLQLGAVRDRAERLAGTRPVDP